MNRNRTNRFLWTALAAGMCLLTAALALADAMAAAWGRADVTVAAAGSSLVRYNDDPSLWYINAEATGKHSHSALDYDAHTEQGGATYPWPSPDGHNHPPEALDGTVWAGDVISGDGAGEGGVGRVTVSTDFAGGPSIVVEESQNVYSSVTTADGGTADAEGIGEHDVLFWIEHAGGAIRRQPRR